MVLRIIVKEKITKIPIPFVYVTLTAGAKKFIDDTNMNGVAEFSGVPDGDYIVKIRHADYRPYTEKMFISQNSIINIKMQKAFD